MLKIEIDAQDVVILQKTFSSNGDKPARTIYWQQAYMYNGGRYPVAIQIPLDEGVPANPAGEYELHPSAFQVSKYNKIEINAYNVALVPIKNNSSSIKVA
jgi:hypothetical protein